MKHMAGLLIGCLLVLTISGCDLFDTSDEQAPFEDVLPRGMGLGSDSSDIYKGKQIKLIDNQEDFKALFGDQFEASGATIPVIDFSQYRVLFVTLGSPILSDDDYIFDSFQRKEVKGKDFLVANIKLRIRKSGCSGGTGGSNFPFLLAKIEIPEQLVVNEEVESKSCNG